MNNEQGTMNKEELRQFVKQKIAAVTDVCERSAAIRQRFDKYLRNPQSPQQHPSVLKQTMTIMRYVPFGNEVAPTDIDNDSCFPLVVPFVQDNNIVPVQIESKDELVSGHFGILEPKPEIATLTERRLAHAEIDAVIVPGLAFDKKCKRLGRGKGFYDRFLKTWKTANLSGLAVGFAFDCQIVNEIPTDSWDMPLDAVITESRFFCAKNRTRLTR